MNLRIRLLHNIEGSSAEIILGFESSFVQSFNAFYEQLYIKHVLDN